MICWPGAQAYHVSGIWTDGEKTHFSWLILNLRCVSCKSQKWGMKLIKSFHLYDLLGQKVLFGTHYLRPNESMYPPFAKFANTCDRHPLKHCITLRNGLNEGSRNKEGKKMMHMKLFKIFDNHFAVTWNQNRMQEKSKTCQIFIIHLLINGTTCPCRVISADRALMKHFDLASYDLFYIHNLSLSLNRYDIHLHLQTMILQ